MALGGAVACPAPAPLDRYAQPGRYVGVNLTAKWMAVTALAAERPPAPSAREPRVPMAFSLGAHAVLARFMARKPRFRHPLMLNGRIP
jgi:hypothetical protein